VRAVASLVARARQFSLLSDRSFPRLANGGVGAHASDTVNVLHLPDTTGMSSISKPVSAPCFPGRWLDFETVCQSRDEAGGRRHIERGIPQDGKADFSSPDTAPPWQRGERKRGARRGRAINAAGMQKSPTGDLSSARHCRGVALRGTPLTWPSGGLSPPAPRVRLSPRSRAAPTLLPSRQTLDCGPAVGSSGADVARPILALAEPARRPAPAQVPALVALASVRSRGADMARPVIGEFLLA